MSNAISLALAAEPRLARLVRMTASNVGVLSSMSLDRVEDVRMAAEEAFIYACAACPGETVSISFDVDDERLAMDFALPLQAFPDELDETAVYADLILGGVCDSYERREAPATLALVLKADVK